MKIMFSSAMLTSARPATDAGHLAGTGHQTGRRPVAFAPRNNPSGTLGSNHSTPTSSFSPPKASKSQPVQQKRARLPLLQLPAFLTHGSLETTVKRGAIHAARPDKGKKREPWADRVDASSAYQVAMTVVGETRHEKLDWAGRLVKDPASPFATTRTRPVKSETVTFFVHPKSGRVLDYMSVEQTDISGELRNSSAQSYGSIRTTNHEGQVPKDLIREIHAALKRAGVKIEHEVRAKSPRLRTSA